jgi:hypothetical protein
MSRNWLNAILGALRRVDGFLTTVGRNCCLGRSQAELQREVKTEREGERGSDLEAAARAFGENRMRASH